MNILHHKSWHVRTKRNIARVRRDEANAESADREKERRVLLAQQEARTELLRSRSRAANHTTGHTSGHTSSATLADASDSPKHVDLFEGLDHKSGITNKEHEKEAKEEKEKWEKSINLLTFLNESDDNAIPWYLLSHEKRMNIDRDDKKGDYSDANYVKELNRKKYHDPIEDMNKYLSVMKRNKSGNEKEETKRGDKTDKKTKHSSKSHSSRKSSKSIEELRAERLRREKAERERTRQLLMAKDQHFKPDSFIADERKRGYNSQFNPQIARQNERS